MPKEMKMTDGNDPVHGFSNRIGTANDNVPIYQTHSGLTKRELFAAMAMQGIMADPQIDMSAYEVAVCAIANADALIAALSKGAE